MKFVALIHNITRINNNVNMSNSANTQLSPPHISRVMRHNYYRPDPFVLHDITFLQHVTDAARGDNCFFFIGTLDRL